MRPRARSAPVTRPDAWRTTFSSLAKFPADTVGNTRNDMYLVSEAIRFLIGQLHPATPGMVIVQSYP